MKTKIGTRELFKWVTDKTTNGLNDKQLDWLINELKNTCPDGIELSSGDETINEPYLPIDSVIKQRELIYNFITWYNSKPFVKKPKDGLITTTIVEEYLKL